MLVHFIFDINLSTSSSFVFTVKFKSFSLLSPLRLKKLKSFAPLLSPRLSKVPFLAKYTEKKFVYSWKIFLIYDENEFQMKLVNDSLSEFCAHILSDWGMFKVREECEWEIDEHDSKLIRKSLSPQCETLCWNFWQVFTPKSLLRTKSVLWPHKSLKHPWRCRKWENIGWDWCCRNVCVSGMLSERAAHKRHIHVHCSHYYRKHNSLSIYNDNRNLFKSSILA